MPDTEKGTEAVAPMPSYSYSNVLQEVLEGAFCDLVFRSVDVNSQSMACQLFQILGDCAFP